MHSTFSLSFVPRSLPPLFCNNIAAIRTIFSPYIAYAPFERRGKSFSLQTCTFLRNYQRMRFLHFPVLSLYFHFYLFHLLILCVAATVASLRRTSHIHSRTKSLFDLNFVLLKISIPFFQCSSMPSFSCIYCLLSSKR